MHRPRRPSRPNTPDRPTPTRFCIMTRMVARIRKKITGQAPFFSSLMLAPKPTLVKKKSMKAVFRVSSKVKVKIPV